MYEEELKEKLLETSFFKNNSYFKKYIKLILKNLNNEKIKFETERHHILPKSYFKIVNITDKRIIDAKSNLVNLLYKDHILAHYYLYFCANDEQFKQDNLVCFINMTNEKSVYIDTVDLFKKLNSYEELRKIWKLQLSLKTKGKKNKKVSEWLKMHHFDCSEENNSRARTVYVYDLYTFKLITTYGAQCIASKNLIVSNLKEKLNRSKYGVVILEDKIVTKKYPLDKEAVKLEINNLEIKNNLKNYHRRYKREFRCPYCGKKYVKYLNDLKYQNYLKKVEQRRICCADCSRNGMFVKNKLKSEKHKNRISLSAVGRKWINNGVEQRQVHDDEMILLLNTGWKLGQLPGIKMILNDKIRTIKINHIDEYKQKGWMLYEERASN